MQSSPRKEEKTIIPLSQQFLAKAWQYLTESDFETALKCVNKAIENAPLKAYLLRGQIYLAKFYHNNAEYDNVSRNHAVADFKKVLELDAKDGQELIAEAKFIIQYTYEILLKVKLLNIEKALPDEDSKSLLKRAVQINLLKKPTPEFYTHAKLVWSGNIAAKNHLYEEAIEKFKTALTHFKDNSLMFGKIANCFRSMAEQLDIDNPLQKDTKIQYLDNAINYFNLVTHYPGGKYAYYESAICYTLQKSYKKAIETFMYAFSEDDVELEYIKPIREVAIQYLKECHTDRVQHFTETKNLDVLSKLRELTALIYHSPKNAELYLLRAIKWHELNKILIAQEDIVVAIWLIQMKMYRVNDSIIALRDQIETLFTTIGDSLRDTDKELAEHYYRSAMFVLGKSIKRLQKKIKGLAGYQSESHTFKTNATGSIKKKKKKKKPKVNAQLLKINSNPGFFKSKCKGGVKSNKESSEVKVDATLNHSVSNETSSVPDTVPIVVDNELKSKQMNFETISAHSIFSNPILKDKLDTKIKPIRKINRLQPNKFFKKVIIPESILNKMALLQKAGAFRVYLVGGWLREAVISDAPPTDIDFVIGCDNAANVLSQAFPDAKFENIGQFYKIKYKGEEFDIWHSVPLSDKSLSNEEALKRDAFLRDLTINTIYMDILKKYYDPTGRGVRDLHNRKLHTVIGNEQCFSEDSIRILKLIKFLAQHNWILPIKMEQSIVKAAEKKLLQSCQKEPQRVNSCLHKLFCRGFAKNSFALLEKLKLLPYLFPGLQDVINVPNKEKAHLLSVLESADYKCKENGLGKPSLKYIYDQIMIVCSAIHTNPNAQLKETENANILFQAMTHSSLHNKTATPKV